MNGSLWGVDSEKDRQWNPDFPTMYDCAQRVKKCYTLLKACADSEMDAAVNSGAQAPDISWLHSGALAPVGGDQLMLEWFSGVISNKSA